MITSLATNLIHSYGYLAIILLVAVECVGVPLPGESTLIAAALYAGSTHRLNIVAIATLAAAAAVAGDNIGYGVGYLAGPRLLLATAERCISLTGGLPRPVPLSSPWRQSCLLRPVRQRLPHLRSSAGRGEPHAVGRFLACNAAGGLVWAAVYSFGAYGLGTAANGVGLIITVVGLAVAALAALTMAVIGRHSYGGLEQRALATEAGAPSTVAAR